MAVGMSVVVAVRSFEVKNKILVILRIHLGRKVVDMAVGTLKA
jgi:hypothetical protein